ncbi:MAG: hypothetical protein COB93_01025 [Sneathiella sp.]|nr:MAG: hypothetical protein COB93_01025 [Sneathiella sp.]
MKSPLFGQKIIRTIAFSIALSPLFAVSTASAPQIMAIASTDLAVPITCEGGLCSVELSAICLQEHRASPTVGTAYYVHGDNRFELIGTTNGGQKITLSHLDIKIESVRGHNAIKVGFREVALKKYGPMSLQISVPKNISVVPLPIANDVNPQTDADIEIATGPYRQLARTMIDEDTQKRNAAELLNQTINRLPWRGRATDDERASVKAAYDGITANSGFSSPAKDNANAVIEECYNRTRAGRLTFRQCLGSWHDRLIGKLNTKYWKQLKAGS